MKAAKGQHLRENADKVDGTGPDFTIGISCQNQCSVVKPKINQSMAQWKNKGLITQHIIYNRNLPYQRCVKCMFQLPKPLGEVARPDSMLSVQLLMPQHNYLLIYTPCGVENLPILYKIPGWSHSISAYLELPLEKKKLLNMFYFSPFQWARWCPLECALPGNIFLRQLLALMLNGDAGHRGIFLHFLSIDSLLPTVQVFCGWGNTSIHLNFHSKNTRGLSVWVLVIYLVTANHQDNAHQHHCLSTILTSCLTSDYYGIMAHIVLAFLLTS